jgi:hypothetical protein
VIIPTAGTPAGKAYRGALSGISGPQLAAHALTGALDGPGSPVQRWMAWLLDRYSNAYASNQYRALQQFFKWLAAEDELSDPMTGLQPPRHREASPGLHRR